MYDSRRETCLEFGDYKARSIAIITISGINTFRVHTCINSTNDVSIRVD